MSNFGEKLRDLRIDKGVSIQKMAKDIGIGATSICRWENNQSDIRCNQLIILSKYFNVTVDYLLGLED